MKKRYWNRQTMMYYWPRPRLTRRRTKPVDEEKAKWPIERPVETQWRIGNDDPDEETVDPGNPDNWRKLDPMVLTGQTDPDDEPRPMTDPDPAQTDNRTDDPIVNWWWPDSDWPMMNPDWTQWTMTEARRAQPGQLDSMTIISPIGQYFERRKEARQWDSES